MPKKSKIASTSLKSLAGGILEPVMTYRFRVEFYPNNIVGNDLDCLYDLTSNIAYVIVNFQKKEIEVSIRQSVASEVMRAAQIIAQTGCQINVCPMSSRIHEPIWTLHLADCKCLDHSIKFDYSITGVAIHQFVFKFSHSSII